MDAGIICIIFLDLLNFIKIRALIDTPALDWQSQNPDSFGNGRGLVVVWAGEVAGVVLVYRLEITPRDHVSPLSTKKKFCVIAAHCLIREILEKQRKEARSS
ncbi:hypothetical protein ACET3Z_014165 [Daucus carota]